MKFLKLQSIDFMGHRKVAYGISIFLIVISVLSLGIQKLNYGVDFAGGTLLQYRFSREVSIEEIRDVLAEQGLAKSVIQRFSPQEFVIRTVKLGEEEKKALETSLGEKLGEVQLVRIEEVGPAISLDLRRAGFIAFLGAIAGILVYVSLRFEFRPAVTSVIALIHDGIVVLGLLSLFQREFTAPVLAAILTVLGYSINDSIVLMDRVRENLKLRKKEESFTGLVNRSINEMLSRTINTSLTTLLPVIALLFFGGKMLQDFAFTLFAGIVVGTYSSIFIASSLLVDWEARSPRRR
ncbi:MAG: preprotein translocase subunit SecF [Candidatus Atribacteria bacterium]|jgi:preprotein translocase subunit SecF|uniref:protein translocase subunit SecF n=1 Tax=Atrimonas thermophila TaxID=3064161 RepID=UPI0024ABA9F9|nr:preprotein translocase subunit SecF [Candidatus Atribacteria bacterium]MDI3530544.1 preprotein translocase subunit SecF [Candidatus Atribacteria bacterium]